MRDREHDEMEELRDEARRREEEAERRARHAPAPEGLFANSASESQQRRREAVRSVLVRQAVAGRDRVTDEALDEIIAAAETGI